MTTVDSAEQTLKQRCILEMLGIFGWKLQCFITFRKKTLQETYNFLVLTINFNSKVNLLNLWTHSPRQVFSREHQSLNFFGKKLSPEWADVPEKNWYLKISRVTAYLSITLHICLQVTCNLLLNVFAVNVYTLRFKIPTRDQNWVFHFSTSWKELNRAASEHQWSWTSLIDQFHIHAKNKKRKYTESLSVYRNVMYYRLIGW